MQNDLFKNHKNFNIDVPTEKLLLGQNKPKNAKSYSIFTYYVVKAAEKVRI